MRLSELCEPIFHYACLLSRSGRRGGAHDLNQVRSEVRALFEDTAARAAADPKLRNLYERVELPLMVFLDMTIKESGLKFAREWRDFAAEKTGEENGDERFFDLLDDALRDPSSQATEALGIFYTCIGLGFSGWYAGNPEHLRKRQREIAARLRVPTEVDRGRIVPEAYEHVDTSNLIQTPGASLAGIGIALLGLTIVLFVANAFLYRASSRDLNEAVGDLLNHTATATAAAPAPAPPAGSAPTTAK
jgi:type VI protein secretion system component VasF